MSTLAQRLNEAARRLATVTETPRLDAELLLAHALDTTRSRLLSRIREDIPAPGFDALLQRRLAYEPIAYITGTWEFFSLEFEVEKPLLVPRPETEHLVEAALQHLKDHPTEHPHVLEIGTGTGCVAISIARQAPGARVTATDIHPTALAIARKNALRHQTALDLRAGDLFTPIGADERFEVIVSNPPYVESVEWCLLSPVIRLHEDPRALLGGPDGLDLIRRIIPGARKHLVHNGLLALEIGEKQQRALADLLEQAGFREIRFVNDLAGIPRIACAQA